jgi:hypothetical protein
MNEHQEYESDVAAIIDHVKKFHGVEIGMIEDPEGNVPTVPVMVLPEGKRMSSLKGFIDEFRDRPERRKGKAELLDLDSFIGHINRFKDEDSVVFADNRWSAMGGQWVTPTLTGVLDYHEAVNEYVPSEDGKSVDRNHIPDALPRFGEHRAFYSFPLSREFMAWMGGNGRGMNQGEFAAFLEEHALDVEPPPVNDKWFTGEAPAPKDDAPEADRKRYEFMSLLHTMTKRLNGTWAGPEKMMDMSRGLRVNENNKVASTANLSNGTGSIVFESEHTNAAGEKVDVPNLFLIAIPIFKNGPRYMIPVRLRYRAKDGRITWFYDTYRHDKVFDLALDEALSKVRTETGLPVLVGIPE